MKREYVANALSLLRPLLASWICFMIFKTMGLGSTVLPWYLLIVWLAIAVTDFADGKAARRFGKTASGGIVDEQCDKIAINMVMFMLCVFGAIPWYFFAIMLGRDIAVTIIRVQTRKAGFDVVTNAQMPGKLKTCFQFALVCVALLPATLTGGEWLHDKVLYVGSAITMGASLVSGMQILLLALNARNPKWLEGSGGEIGEPNWFSLIRLAVSLVIPHIVGVQAFGASSNVIAIVMLAIILPTDAIDGRLARRLKKETKAGKALDPLADKLIFYPMAIALMIATKGTFLVPGIHEPTVLMVVWASIIMMVARDLAYIVWFALNGKKLSDGMDANLWDKVRANAMFVWVCALVLAMCAPGLPLGAALTWLGFIALFAIGPLSIASGAVAIYRVRDLMAKLGE